MAESPTQRTLRLARKRGWYAEVVEHGVYVPSGQRKRIAGISRMLFYMLKRRDLIGIGDVLCLDGEPGSHLIQTTSGSGHSARRKKALAEPRLGRWLSSGNRFSVWSWRKLANGRWNCREEEINLERYTDECTCEWDAGEDDPGAPGE